MILNGVVRLAYKKLRFEQRLKEDEGDRRAIAEGRAFQENKAVLKWPQDEGIAGMVKEQPGRQWLEWGSGGGRRWEIRPERLEELKLHGAVQEVRISP